MAPHNNHHNTNSPTPIHKGARILGTSTAGLVEFGIFFPFDTTAKRLMSSQYKLSEGYAKLNQVIFKDAANLSAPRKLLSLYPGIKFGIAHKVLQRTYKFSVQPIIKEMLYKSRFSKYLENNHTQRTHRYALEALASAAVGTGEVLLLPIDSLKVKSQVNIESIQNRSFIDMVLKERFRMFNGAGWTIARNIPGSISLFCGSAVTKDLVFGLGENDKPSLYQTFVAAAVGSFCSITFVQPIDLIKTRIQKQNFDQPVSGFKIARDVIRNEGLTAFYHGVGPKIITVAPKVMFAFTVSQYFTQLYGESRLFSKSL